MKSEIYLLDKKIGKRIKNLREKQKFRYLDNIMAKMTCYDVKIP